MGNDGQNSWENKARFIRHGHHKWLDRNAGWWRRLTKSRSRDGVSVKLNLDPHISSLSRHDGCVNAWQPHLGFEREELASIVFVDCPAGAGQSQDGSTNRSSHKPTPQEASS
jgi:hypothetical protein